MRPRILFVDAHDSFSNNITSLLATLLDADVHVLAIDSPSLSPSSPSFRRDLRDELSRYHAVVCGPGPGSPAVPGDVGLMSHVWELEDEHLVPVLGVCLGFQSLAASLGADVVRLRRGLHGVVRDIDHRGLGGEGGEDADVFAGVGSFGATLYHSLGADVGQQQQQGVGREAWDATKWRPPTSCPDLVPLAWAYEPGERILMAARHRRKPFWGLQYHPESVCTDEASHQVVRNWFELASRWSSSRGRDARPGTPRARAATRESLLSRLRCRQACWAGSDDGHAGHGLGFVRRSRRLRLGWDASPPDVVEALGLQQQQQQHIILDSSNAGRASSPGGVDCRGRFSVVALDVDDALKLEHHVGRRFVTARRGPRHEVESAPLDGYDSVWQLLSHFAERRRLPPDGDGDDDNGNNDDNNDDDDDEFPFRGGWMGYVTYEMGLAGIGVSTKTKRRHSRPDLCFAWVTRSVVIDHRERLLHVQELASPAETGSSSSWIDATLSRLASALGSPPALGASPDDDRPCPRGRHPSTTAPGAKPPRLRVRRPDQCEYRRKVRRCQDLIAAGESYELCLTDQTTITTPRPALAPRLSPWRLYKTLRARQPSPFGSFVRLSGATLVSSSPERFLAFDRRGLCSMHPMKGTVRRSSAVATAAAAEALLRVPKETAENLMIVDLVRHDLHGVCGPGSVDVPSLMAVEEHASVYQMVTLVRGRLRPGEGHTGLDVLAASLPPGSMTGAPKRRSCELLLDLEAGRERSLYSGVVGYMDVTGRGDWSVTIRSLFRWDDEDEDEGEGEGADGGETWRVGAGGAVTILSTDVGEWDEMNAKLAGALGSFEAFWEAEAAGEQLGGGQALGDTVVEN